MTRLPSMWPHFFGMTWSSMCSAATPAAVYSRTVRTTLSGPAVAVVGVGDDRHRDRLDTNRRAWSAISVIDSSPTSGRPSSDAVAP